MSNIIISNNTTKFLLQNTWKWKSCCICLAVYSYPLQNPASPKMCEPPALALEQQRTLPYQEMQLWKTDNATHTFYNFKFHVCTKHENLSRLHMQLQQLAGGLTGAYKIHLCKIHAVIIDRVSWMFFYFQLWLPYFAVVWWARSHLIKGHLRNIRFKLSQKSFISCFFFFFTQTACLEFQLFPKETLMPFPIKFSFQLL